jgi:hypothetical protein
MSPSHLRATQEQSPPQHAQTQHDNLQPSGVVHRPLEGKSETMRHATGRADARSGLAKRA